MKLKIGFLVLLIVPALGSAKSGDPASRIVQLLHTRLLISRDVAKAKHNSGAAVEDRVRERAVVEAAVRAAKGEVVSPALVRSLWSAQIEASKMVQRAYLARWRAKGKFAWAPDLRKQVRPRLDALGSEVASLLPEVDKICRTEKGRARLRRLAAHQQWPKGEEYAYLSAWRVAVGPLLRRR